MLNNLILKISLYLGATTNTYEKTKRIHPELVRKLPQEKIKSLKTAHYDTRGYYDQNSELVRENRLARYLKEHGHELHSTASFNSPSERLKAYGELEFRSLIREAQLIDDASPESKARMAEIVTKIYEQMQCSEHGCY